ncbi:hypothetical protein AMATHDRAFT_39392, partial [Amanita thiersii Skay4041]
MEHAARVVELITICQIASTVTVLYDWLITLDEEVDLVWSRQWSFAKILFLLNRYFGTLSLVMHLTANLLATPPSNNVSGIWLQLQNWCTSFVIWLWSLQFVLVYRSFATHNNFRGIECIVTSGYIFQVLTMLALLVGLSITTRGVHHSLISKPNLYPDILPKAEISRSFPSSSVCIQKLVPPYFSAFWLPAIFLNLVFAILAIRITIRHAQVTRVLGRDQSWGDFIQNGIFYFI